MATSSDLTQIWQWNELVPASVDRCVDVIIQERIDIQPDAPAICAWDGSLTYAELGRAAMCLASWLIHQGISPDTTPIIPLCFEKSRWTAVGMLGVLKAGVGFVLIDPHQPEHRLRNIVTQVGAEFIVSSQHMKELSSRLAPRSIVVSSKLLEDMPSLVELAPSFQDPCSIAYVAFTSGSTGEPKGALISHRNLASALHHQQQKMAFTASTRFYDFSSYSFDASIGIFFTTLSAGGCICVPSEDDRRNNLVQSIASLGANTVDMTPSVATLLSPELVPSLETLILGGEPLKVRDVSRWWGSVRVMSFYGPCECTPTSTINYNAQTPQDAIHLGKGAGLVTWIVDPEDHQSLVPLGDVGELLLEGPLVGLGYLHDSKRTAASFVEDPIWLLAGEAGRLGRQGRLYKTGDLVRYHDDGSLVFVSRRDTQIKIRGQRIELGEIENILRGHDGVDDAVAVLHKDQDIGSEWITTFVTVLDPEVAFQDLFSVQKWATQLTSRSIPTSVGDHALRRRVLARRDFTRWELMYDSNGIDMKKLGGWLTGIIDPMANGVNTCIFPENWDAFEFVLFSLSTARPTSNGTVTPHMGAVKFISKIIDSTPSVEKTFTEFKEAPGDFVPNCQAISSGLVVLNSITHLFPSLAYLFNVIKEASRLDGANTIVLGHIHSSVSYKESLAEGAVRHFGEAISPGEILGITKARLDESELLIHPEFFNSLLDKLPDKIANVEIIPNETDYEVRLGAFRYTAVIHINRKDTLLQVRQVSQDDLVDYEKQGFNHQALFNLLKMSSASTIVPVINIPYSRFVHGKRLLQLLQSCEGEVTNRSDWISCARISNHECSLSVNDLVDLAKQTDRWVKVSWALRSSQRGTLTAIFYQKHQPEDKSGFVFRFPRVADLENPVSMLGSRPRRQNINNKIEIELLGMLQKQLPSYMIPHVIKVLDKMPLNNNGKALGTMTQRRARQYTLILEDEMLSQSESQVRQIWGNSLGIEPTTIGRNDRFFDIGGDSITAMKVVLEARKHNLTITVQDVFLLEVHEMAHRISFEQM